MTAALAVVLSLEDRADLREAARLGLVSEGLLTELLDRERDRERAARAEAASIRERAAYQRKHGVSIEDVRFKVTAARREVEIARKNGREPSIRQAETLLSHFEKRLADALAQRASSRVQQPTSELRKVELPADAVEPLALLRELRRLAGELSRVATSSRVVPETPIGELDAQLCLTWGNFAPLPNLAQSSAVDRLRAIKSYDTGRLLSARNAEKAALRYYKLLGFNVEDVSSTQLASGASSWKDFDIRAGKHRIDVKNARASLHGNGHYVEHCVPAFKLSRESGAQVRIAAVVSPYLAETGPYFSWPREATVLGEVGAADISALIDWASAKFGRHLELRDPTRARFLPGWLFEFPPIHYPGRQSAADEVPEMLRKFFDALAYTCEIPGWLWVFSDERIPEGLSTASVLHELRELRKSIGISRRSLYVLALGLALEDLRSDGSGQSQLRALMDVCRVPTESDTEEGPLAPLGLHDPLGYVQNLMSMLSEIVSTLRQLAIDVVGFRLVNPSILEGVLRGGRRMTLFAYCGGWQRHPFLARCGKSPLSVSRHVSCPACAHLICDMCGHCAGGCDRCEPRQVALANAPIGQRSGERSRPDGGRKAWWDFPF